MEEATYLTKYAGEVVIVHRREAFRASKIMAERVLANPKIRVEWNSRVAAVVGDDFVTALRLEDTVTGEQRGRVESRRGHTWVIVTAGSRPLRSVHPSGRSVTSLGDTPRMPPSRRPPPRGRGAGTHRTTGGGAHRHRGRTRRAGRRPARTRQPAR